jgi:hypothetical protein
MIHSRLFTMSFPTYRTNPKVFTMSWTLTDMCSKPTPMPDLGAVSSLDDRAGGSSAVRAVTPKLVGLVVVR